MSAGKSGLIGCLIGLLRNAGIAADDNDEVRLNKTLLVFATALVSAASLLWLPIYWGLGAERCAVLTFLFQVALTGNLASYLRSHNFHAFRLRQLALFLLFPFVAQWSMGSFVASSGLILWGLLGPIAAILCFGVSESRKWFVAYVSLIALTVALDLFISDAKPLAGVALANRATPGFVVLNLAAISSIVYLLLRYAMQQKQRLEAMLVEAHHLLEIEQSQSRRLLRNVLPDAIAERLKSSDQPIADGFADVTVMFADIVNFTPVAATLAPADVFSLLNRIFSSFDELVEQHGLEKIKTIGDAYMVAGGLTGSTGDHTRAMASLALAMQDTLRQGFVVNGQRLGLRIGMATGAVVAGVVGKKKFTYDLWGDTVNLASRLSDEAQTGVILADATTRNRLHQQFDLLDLGPVALKGKGNVAAFRLIGRRAKPRIPPDLGINIDSPALRAAS